LLTAAGNDYGFETIFARQVAGLGCPGDVLLVISTRAIHRMWYVRSRKHTGAGCIRWGCSAKTVEDSKN
jgi:hypothetical protein